MLCGSARAHCLRMRPTLFVNGGPPPPKKKKEKKKIQPPAAQPAPAAPRVEQGATGAPVRVPWGQREG